MTNQQDYQVPLPSEKLSYKFILDSLKDDMRKQASTDPIESATPQMEELFSHDVKPKSPLPLPDDKKYFRIGEASDFLGVEPYVLRYWESEFKSVKPIKSSTGHRVYSRKDVELLQQIRMLLHEEKFSIKGAKKKLLEGCKETKARTAQENLNGNSNKQVLKHLQQELRELIALAKQPI